MKLTFRWYGPDDSISLKAIRQIPGVTGVVTAVYNTPAGSAWSKESIASIKEMCSDEGLKAEVIESVPVHEDIKLGTEKRDVYIDNYCLTVKRLGEAGIKCICYNFMPVFDWLRTNLHTSAPDGSDSLSYRHSQISVLDPKHLSLPGWDESYTPDEMSELLEKYSGITHEKLFDNLVYFLKKVIPVCEEYGINMAIHPDDPPWDVFGLPRIISCADDYERLFDAVPSNANGITFCTGSLGAGRQNDLVKMAYDYARRGKIHFAHIRNIAYSDKEDFTETAHPTDCGSLDIYSVVKALVKGGFSGYVRPDHGRNIWGENAKPGYGLYDRALGACYLNGLFEAVEKGEK